MVLPKKRLFRRQFGRFELGLSIDLRDVWVGLYWRNETYRQVGDGPDYGWLHLWEFYLCPVPCIVLSLRFP